MRELKQINTGGISWLEPLTGNADWYWGTDYTSGEHSRFGDGFVPPHCVVVVMVDEHLSAGLSVASVFD